MGRDLGQLTRSCGQVGAPGDPGGSLRSLLLPRKDFENPGITRAGTPGPHLQGTLGAHPAAGAWYPGISIPSEDSRSSPAEQQARVWKHRQLPRGQRPGQRACRGRRHQRKFGPTCGGQLPHRCPAAGPRLTPCVTRPGLPVTAGPGTPRSRCCLSTMVLEK